MGGMSGGVPLRSQYQDEKGYQHNLKKYENACEAFEASCKKNKKDKPKKKKEIKGGLKFKT